MKKADKVYSQIINSENDAEYLKVGKEYIEDINYPGAPTADRVRAKWKKPHITKVKVKKYHHEEDETGMDPEELRIKRMQ
jgi:hypothetical protein